MLNLESNTTHELKERLKTELATESPDSQTVTGILEELEKRNPVKEIPIEAVAAWNKIRANKHMRTHRIWKPLLKVAVVAVVALTLLGTVPHAFGMENIFDLIGRWTKDFFTFGEPNRSEFCFKTEHPGLQELYDTITEIGVTRNIVPTWIPDGFEVQELVKQSSPKGITVFAKFLNGEKEIQIYVLACKEKRDIEYQKDENIVEIWELSGVKYYILENEEIFSVVWAIDNLECSIYADAKSDLKKMIKSINEEEY